MEPFAPKNLPSDAPVAPAAQSVASSTFVPFARVIQGDKEKAQAGVPAETHGLEHGSSTVEYVEEEGVVKKIIVTCRCGEVTEIDCLYEGE